MMLLALPLVLLAASPTPGTARPTPTPQPRPTQRPTPTPTPFPYDRQPANFYQLTARGVFVQAHELSQVPPSYPREAITARTQGRVTLDVLIRTDGTVGEVVVLRGAVPLLDQAAIAAVKQYRYRSATLDGRPIATWATVSMDFTLK